MVSINYSAREVCCKIVYYGPGLSGKTTNLQYVHAKVPSNTRGKLISLATEADRTLYFDFLPINIGTINGFAAKFQLYTVPGQVYYNATRKLVLRGVDGLCFVADSQPSKMDENIESLTNLEENLREYGYDINDIPIVIQYNKRDLPGVLPVAELEAQLNTRGWPSFEASATVGNGVFDTLKMIIKVVLDKAKNTGAAKPKPISQPISGTAAADQPEPGLVKPPEAAPPPAEAPDAAAPADESSPEPETGRQPAPATEAGQPATDHSQAATATAEEPRPVQYRPYPGSREEQRASSPSTDNRPSPATAGTDSPSPGADHRSEPGDSSGSQGSAPRMAPPLRRREDKKKRGFFKRLFGMK